MISDIVAWLFALFVMDPLQAQISERLERAKLSVSAIEQSRQCVASHGPELVARAGEEPGWAITTAVGVATGWTSPAELFDARDPNCTMLFRAIDADNAQVGEA